MANDRNLKRTRARILAAARAEFAAKGLAGSRTDAIARRARVNEGMIFYCFKTKEGLYREVMRVRIAEARSAIESHPTRDFAGNLVRGFENACANAESVRMWQWEALGQSRKLLAEQERRAFFESQVAQLRGGAIHELLPEDVDEEMMVLVSVALRLTPLAFPQITRLISGCGPEDAEFREKWIKCLRWLGERIAPSPAERKNGRRDGGNGVID